MDKGTGIGLGVALVFILGAAVVEAGGIGMLVALPMERVMKLGKIIGVAFHQDETSERHLVSLFVQLADRARREGLLALESEAANIEDESIKKGVMLVVDGTDPE